MRNVASFSAIGLILGCWSASALAEPALKDSLQISGTSSPRIENPGSAFKSSLRFGTGQPNSEDSRSVNGPNFKSSIKIEGAK
jgi:hypothetical protein